ncbi:hypothetical protein HBH77_110170 [Parastagonospora nodorum]|nr:hypothetical protein HBH50_158940 [Parastagonospora nodorum]KAH4092106.1 hypothetical protein HBH48_082000 [Parastagonospora nodorum]KAH4174197.1 hypothetical protein HBH43_073090 [Parastagonospora nodorum]KAH4969682.1 hypothetical protein HBI78_052310 [Parastagonospora nodorum]KAH5203982.1 hypothetical protein HBH77_110170 [Parastagonospora nodorum]
MGQAWPGCFPSVIRHSCQAPDTNYRACIGAGAQALFCSCRVTFGYVAGEGRDKVAETWCSQHVPKSWKCGCWLIRGRESGRARSRDRLCSSPDVNSLLACQTSGLERNGACFHLGTYG